MDYKQVFSGYTIFSKSKLKLGLRCSLGPKFLACIEVLILILDLHLLLPKSNHKLFDLECIWLHPLSSHCYCMWNAVTCCINRQHRSLVVRWNQSSSAWKARKVEYEATWWVRGSIFQHERSSLLIQTWGSIKLAFQRPLLRTWPSQKSWLHSTLTGECRGWSVIVISSNILSSVWDLPLYTVNRKPHCAHINTLRSVRSYVECDVCTVGHKVSTTTGQNWNSVDENEHREN